MAADLPDAWAVITAEAAQDLTPENVARWFLPARLVADAGDELRVAVPDEFHRRWLGERLRGVVERAAGRAGLGGRRVVFEVAGLRA